MSAVLPDARGRFGAFGGQYVPETLMSALAELESVYREARERLKRGDIDTDEADPSRG